MKPTYFGQPDKPLFGVYHRPRGSATSPVRSVVICPPIGQEYIRSHWCLRLLAAQLARKGIHVLRFDYSGVGDSRGSIDEIQSLQFWEADIRQAIRFLKSESGAPSVMLLGVRTGALLATRVAQGTTEVNSMLFWEPTSSGAEFLRQMRQLHREMLDLWVCSMKTENSNTAEEILGSRYPRSLLNELEDSTIEWNAIEHPHLVVDVRSNETYESLRSNPMRKFEWSGDEDSWFDLSQLETAWLRPQSARANVSRIDDTFNRLERFGILTASNEVLV